MKKLLLFFACSLLCICNLSAQTKQAKKGSAGKAEVKTSAVNADAGKAGEEKRLSKSAFVKNQGEDKQFVTPLFLVIPNLDEAGGDFNKLEETVQTFVKESGNQIHSNAFYVKKMNTFIVLFPQGKDDAKPGAWKAACLAVSKNFNATAFASLEEFSSSFPFDNYGLAKEQTENFIKEMLPQSK